MTDRPPTLPPSVPPSGAKPPFPYLHGFSPGEQARLIKQAELMEFPIYRDIDFSAVGRLLEVGSGVAGQTAILLRRFPRLQIDCIEFNERQISAAKTHLATLPYAQGRYKIHHADAQHLGASGTDHLEGFDAAFLCWILEHVPSPARVLSEVRRVVRPGGQVVINEVMNSSFFLEPYSPNIWKYWMAFNDFQHESAGDPFIGAKLGNLLLSQGYRQIVTTPKVLHYDNREPEKRRQAIRYWKELLLSAEGQLTAAGRIGADIVRGMQAEFSQVESAPDAAFFYAFMQASAVVG